MRVFFVGGLVDNSELDLEISGSPPANYPPDTGSGRQRYRLVQAEQRNGRSLYAIYAPPELDPAEVQRIVQERNYAGRFPTLKGDRP